MKNAGFLKYTIVPLLLIAGVCWFILVKKPGPPPPPEPDPPGPVITSQRTGRVLDFGSNEKGDIDKIAIVSGSETIWLHFPPHAAVEIRRVAAVNKMVTVTFGPGRGPKHVQELVSLSASNSGPELLIRDIRPPRPTRGKEVEISGNGIREVINNNGTETSFVLSGRLILLPPHMTSSLFPMLKNAKYILVKGYERDSSDGFVNATAQVVVRPYSIAIDSITYVIQ